MVWFSWFKPRKMSSTWAWGRTCDGGSHSLSIRSPPDRLGAERSQHRVHCQAAKAVHPLVTPSDRQGPRVKASLSHFVPSLALLQIGISMSSPRPPHISIPTQRLALVCWMLTKGGRRWQLAHLLDSYPSALGHKDVLMRCGGREKGGERVGEREKDIIGRCRWSYKENMQHRPFNPSIPPFFHFTTWFLLQHYQMSGPMKACFLPLSTKGPFSASYFCNDWVVLPLSCADRLAQSCCGLLKPRKNTSTPASKTCWQTDIKLSERFKTLP